MPLSLVPRWKPLAFQIPCAPRATSLYEPLIVQDLGLLVAAGPLGIAIFAISKPQGVVANLRAKVWITGVAVNAGLLYIQDGPVLLVHSLARNGLVAARNLVSGVRWGFEDDEPFDADAVYALDAPEAGLQAALLKARLDYAAALITGNTAATGIALLQATRAAASVDFAPPVVRHLQVDARNDAHVFSLRMDGTVYPLKDALEGDSPYEGKPAVTPHLLLVERMQQSGNVLCHLYYVADDGSIVVLDAEGDLEPAPGWAATTRPISGRVLALRHVDGYLMGGGILGADFFVRPLDPTKPPVITVASPSQGWREFDVAEKEKLVLLVGAGTTRLVSYDPAAKQKDRWGERQLPTFSRSIFWTGTGADAQIPTPRLLLEIDINGGAGRPAGFRAGVANTIDSLNPAFTSNYPPPFTALDSGTLTPDSFRVLANTAWVASRPVITNQTLYCVVRSTAPESADGVMALVAYSLDAAGSDLRPKAETALATLRKLAYPPRLVISRYDQKTGESKKPGGWDPRGPYVLGSRPVTIYLDGVETVVNTDAEGAVLFDSTRAGKVVSPKWQAIPAIWAATTTSATLEVGKTVEIRINASGYRD